MKALLMLALLALTACVNEQQGLQEVLVCTHNGKTVYTSGPARDWYVNNRDVWSSWDGYEYRPSALESCYTRKASNEELGR